MAAAAALSSSLFFFSIVRGVPGAATSLASSQSPTSCGLLPGRSSTLDPLCSFRPPLFRHRRHASYYSPPLCSLGIASPSPDSQTISPQERLASIVSDIISLPSARDRTAALLRYATTMLPFPPSLQTVDNRVMGCTARVWVTAQLGQDGKMHFMADSDSEITKGFCAILLHALDTALPEEVLEVSLDGVAVAGLWLGFTASRTNTWYNVLLAMQKRTRMEMERSQGRMAQLFPSLLITADDISAQGSFALAQVKYLQPEQLKVKELVHVLQQKKIGVVAHFYMDPEVQGVLAAARESWPHIHISDSLVMADRAVKMADAGCKHIAVLGVDFMSENVRAILDKAGHEQINVYRMSSERIGCSLAEAAEDVKYLKFLEVASKYMPALHVIYINTSLETKAKAHAIVPTITCTSSNVVQTVLQAFAQVPNISVWYGPDSYMGANLVEMFHQMANMSDDEIAAVHPMHNKQSILSLLPRLHYYQDGACIVHDMFGHEVVTRVRETYSDAFLTAHFEVPGEMFSLAMEAKQRGMGVVGSTQNILDFITNHVKEAMERNFDDKLQFILGTESGMVTAIVGAVQKLLVKAKVDGKESKIAVEIVFPVSSEAITSVPSDSSHESSLSKLTIVPGVSSGEGCSVSGGCASCPYMKMNSLDALLRVCHLIASPMEHALESQLTRRFNTTNISGLSVADLGCEPILNMRYFQSHGSLPQELVDQTMRK